MYAHNAHTHTHTHTGDHKTGRNRGGAHQICSTTTIVSSVQRTIQFSMLPLQEPDLSFSTKKDQAELLQKVTVQWHRSVFESTLEIIVLREVGLFSHFSNCWLLNSWGLCTGRVCRSWLPLKQTQRRKAASFNSQRLRSELHTLSYCRISFNYYEILYGGFNTRRYTLVYGFCFFKLFPIGCIGLNLPI